MKFKVLLYQDEDGVWISEVPSIPGCGSDGPSREEALENTREAIGACLQVRDELGMPLTVETETVELTVNR